MASSTEPENRKLLLDDLKKKSQKLKHLSETIDSFVECTSFISDNMEVKKVVIVISEFKMNVDKLQSYFDNLNVGLYDLSNDDDILPCTSQDPNSKIETETFEAKKELSASIVKKTRVYIENPCYMETALVIARNEATYVEASKFLCKQFCAVAALLRKYFPEDENCIPSPEEGLTCRETDTFAKIRMPLIRILDFFVCG